MQLQDGATLCRRAQEKALLGLRRLFLAVSLGLRLAYRLYNFGPYVPGFFEEVLWSQGPF